MVPPHAADLVDQRLQGVAVVGHRQDGKIRNHEGIGQGGKGQADKNQKAHGGTGCRAARQTRFGPRAHQARDCHHQRQRQREAQRQLAQFAYHLLPSCQRPLFFKASTTSGGMYFSSCLASTSVATKVPFASMAPVATTPWPSRNSAGKTPLKSAGTVLLPSVTRNRTSAPAPCCRLPFSTSPPRRKAMPSPT